MAEYRRRLPHFHPDGAYLFLTWRLWGSLPATAPTARLPTAAQAFVAADRALDLDARGPRWLQQPEIAAVVANAILIGASQRQFYELCAWTVMPNHVHLLVLPKTPVPSFMHWLKGSTARKANQLLGRTGKPFWQDESYDHWVRDRRQLDKIVRYIEENPVSAGLAGAVGQWPWSSAASAC